MPGWAGHCSPQQVGKLFVSDVAGTQTASSRLVYAMQRALGMGAARRWPAHPGSANKLPGAFGYSGQMTWLGCVMRVLRPPSPEGNLWPRTPWEANSTS